MMKRDIYYSIYLVQAFEEEEEGGDGHDHGSEGHDHDDTIIWRGCCVLAGIFVFYMFEFVMTSVKKRLVNTSSDCLCMCKCMHASTHECVLA